ncbi:MAG: IS110 family transposase, partial [Actinomycetota bacterium]|nr:IS110 family transposase [Actinomycetota bacterium]
MRGLSAGELVEIAARFRPGEDPDDVEAATRFALRSVARRYEALSEEIAALDVESEDPRPFGTTPKVVALPPRMGVAPPHP